MKVLQINSVCGIRSTGRICTDIADLLKKNGDDCRIAYGREMAPSKYEDISYHIGNKMDVYFHALISRIFDNVGFASVRATKKFIKWIDEYDPDIVHLHNLHGYYVNIELLFNYLKKRNKPVVWTLHDCWAFTGHCAHFDNIGCSKWKNMGCSICPQKKSYPSCYLIDRSKQNYINKKNIFSGIKNMTIVAPSKWLSELVGKSFLGQYPIEVIYNGIDLSVFGPTVGNFRERYGLQDKTIYLGVASAWGQDKGLYDFYKINEIKTENEAIVLVGLDLKQLNDLPNGIIGITRTNSLDELAEIYTSANVFLNPTYQETFGLTNIEAQACGTPAVTYCTGGSTEGVPYGNTVVKGDVEALLNKSREAIESKTLLDISKFDKEDCYDKYIKLYRTII